MAAESQVTMFGRLPIKMFGSLGVSGILGRDQAPEGQCLIAIKRSVAAQFRVSAGCYGALGFYSNCEALRVTVILVLKNPLQVIPGRRMDSRKYVLALTRLRTWLAG